MDLNFLFFILIFSFAFFVVLIIISNSAKPYQNALKNMGFGIGLLILIVLTKDFTGLDMHLNFFNTSISCILGIPGVLLLTLMLKI